MKRSVSTIILMLCIAFASAAQDRLYFIDQTMVSAYVEEVSKDQIIYRTGDPQHGQRYSVSVYDVYKIVYQDGHVQMLGYGQYEELITQMGGIPNMMRFDSGRLYIGFRSGIGAQHADYLAFNLYGDRYTKARKQRNTGNILCYLGGILLLEGALSAVVDGDAALTIGGLALGAGSLGAGIPLLCKGNKGLNAIADDYNERVMGSSHKASLTLGPCRNGVGLALNF